jgi:hypothetical protein
VSQDQLLCWEWMVNKTEQGSQQLVPTVADWWQANGPIFSPHINIKRQIREEW